MSQLVTYAPTRPLSSDPEELARYTHEELMRLSHYLQALAEGVFFPKTHVAPTKVQDGMVRYADGSDWNPGSGEGLYVRIAGAWVKAA